DIHGGEPAASPWLVFHDDRLAQHLRQFVRDDAYLHVATASGRKRHDNAKPARGPFLGTRHARKPCQQQEREDYANDLHAVSSVKKSNAMRLKRSASVLVRA